MNLIKRLFPYIRPSLGRLITATALMSIVAGISTGTAWLLKYLMDHALVQKDMRALQLGVFGLLGIIFLKSALWYTHTYLTSWVSQTAVRQLRDNVYRHLYSLSMGFFNEKASAGILARLTNDIALIQTALMSGPTIVIRDGLTILGLTGFLFYTNWKFALLVFLVLPVSGTVLTHLGRRSRRASREGQTRMSDMYEIIHEGLAAMPIVKVYQAESREVQEFAQQNRNYFNAIMKLARIDARSAPIMESIGAVILTFLLIVGGRDVILGHWSLGAFMAFVGAAWQMYAPIKKLANVNTQIQQGLAASERVFELLDQKASVVERPDAATAPLLSDELRFEGVTFSYATGGTVLDGVDLTLKKGEIVALVGASGSGKTTIAQLLLRFYDPTQGRVTMDGRDFRDLTIDSLRRQMAVVTQETHLFNDTVLANIAYGRPNATADQVEAAARAAYAHDFISRLPQGYLTIIGERGTRLSGGEKQRLAIARSLLKDPAILVLDEATSALDTASEQAVQGALDRLLQGRTVLMIAHRLSTVRKAHRIVVLDRGRIVEQGTHEDLLARAGAYHQLHALQATI